VLEEADPELDPEEALCTVEDLVAVEEPPEADDPEELVTTEVELPDFDPPEIEPDFDDEGADVDEFVAELAEQDSVMTGGRGGAVG